MLNGLISRIKAESASPFKKRETERERQKRERDRQTDRQTDTDRETQTDRDRESIINSNLRLTTRDPCAITTKPSTVVSVSVFIFLGGGR